MSFNLNNPIAKRATKTVYKDNGKTIKLFVENYSKSDILNEALNHARVEENTDLKVPSLYEVTKLEKNWALVYEYIEGKTLGELMEENPEKLDNYLEKFVEIQLEVLNHQVPLLNRVKDKYKRKISNLKDVDEHIIYELLQRLEGMKNHTKLCHGDFHPSNIVIKDDGSYYIIDWAHVTQGNASADVANTFILFSVEGKSDLAEKYLQAFANKSGIEIKYIQQWIPIVAAARLSKNIPSEKEFLLKCINVVDYE